MLQYRFYNKTAVKEGLPKEEYCSEWYSHFTVAFKFMCEQIAIDKSLGIYDEYEIEIMELKTAGVSDPDNLPEKYKEQFEFYKSLLSGE